jgi:hypothetical protein
VVSHQEQLHFRPDLVSADLLDEACPLGSVALLLVLEAQHQVVSAVSLLHLQEDFLVRPLLDLVDVADLQVDHVSYLDLHAENY